MSSLKLCEELKCINVRVDNTHRQTTASSKAACSLCGESSSTRRFCEDCDLTLCQTCLKHHHKFPQNRDHQVAGLKPAQYSMCSSHPLYPLKYFCVTCKTTTCAECQLLEHGLHERKDVEDEVESVNKRLDEVKLLAENEIEHYKCIQGNLKNQLEQIEKSHRTASTSLTSLKTAILNEIEGIESKNKAVMVDSVSRVKACMSEVENLVEANSKIIRDIDKTKDSFVTISKSKAVEADIPTIKPRVVITEPESPVFADIEDYKKVSRDALRAQAPLGAGTETPTCDYNKVTADVLSAPPPMLAVTETPTCDGQRGESDISLCIRRVGRVAPNKWLYNHPQKISRVIWKLSARRQKRRGDFYLDLSIGCNKFDASKWWRVKAEYRLSLTHPTDGQKSISKNGKHDFRADSKHIVWSTDILWEQLLNEGYTANRNVTVEAHIKVIHVRGR